MKTTHRRDETFSILAWRRTRARSLGYLPRTADLIAFSTIDLSTLERMLQGGCPKILAIYILL